VLELCVRELRRCPKFFVRLRCHKRHLLECKRILVHARSHLLFFNKTACFAGTSHDGAPLRRRCTFLQFTIDFRQFNPITLRLPAITSSTAIHNVSRTPHIVEIWWHICLGLHPKYTYNKSSTWLAYGQAAWLFLYHFSEVTCVHTMKVLVVLTAVNWYRK
jgi:hypothetical protein